MCDKQGRGETLVKSFFSNHGMAIVRFLTPEKVEILSNSVSEFMLTDNGYYTP